MRFLLFSLAVAVYAQKIDESCAKALSQAATAFEESKMSLNSYVNTKPELQSSLSAALDVYKTADTSVYTLTINATMTEPQKMGYKKTMTDFRQNKGAINKAIPATDDASSDVVEDVSILEFSLNEVRKACKL